MTNLKPSGRVSSIRPQFYVQYIFKNIQNSICYAIFTVNFLFYISSTNRKNKQHVKCPGVPSVIKPVPHGPGIPILVPPVRNVDMLLEYDDDVEENMEGPDASSTVSAKEPVVFSQAELNDLAKDLCF